VPDTAPAYAPRMTAVAAPPPARLLSRPVLAWTAWDWGSASFNAVITTFVFTVYLTGDAFTGLQEGDPGFAAAKAALSSGLGWGIAIAGVVVALLAPVLGKRADATGRRRVPMAIATGVVVASMFGMFAITPVPGAFWAGVALVGLGTVAYEIGAVNYNSMLLSISTPRSIGRVSAFGWAAGYVGGIVLLVALYATLIPGGPELLGDLRADGLGIRLCAVVCAVWFLVFGLPVLLTVRDEPGRGPAPTGVLATYRQLFRDIAELGRQDRNLLFFLIASAVFRDGLTGVFTFGAVIASTVFGFTFGQVLIFAVAANLVAGVSTLVSGRFDDRFGPKPVILVSLVGLVVTGTGVFLARDGGTAAFWVGGLLLCLFVGPAQTSSRSLLGRLSPPDRAGELFGLYATTGRAASFIAPAAFAILTTVAQDQGFGILGIVLVLAVGLVLMLPVRGAVSPAQGAGRALEGSDHP
jgi:MFS transporter, UMF1 family